MTTAMDTPLIDTEGDDRVYVVGADDDGGLLVSAVRLSAGYETALGCRYHVCPSCIAGGRLRRQQ